MTASQLYGPYGAVRYQSGTLPTDYGFTHQRADATSGLNYYGARYYDPVAGQFASADTASAGGLNRYGYVGGNPETKSDPTGHRSTYAGPFWSYVNPDPRVNPGTTVAAISSTLALASQMRAAFILRRIQKTVVKALDYQHNVEFYRMQQQGANPEDLVNYATESYRNGNLTTAARGSGKAAQEAEAATTLMENGGEWLRAAKWVGYAGLVIAAAFDGYSSYEEWLTQHPGDTGGAVGFGAAHAIASTAGSLAGAAVGGVAGTFIGAAIGSVVPGPGTLIGGYIGGFVGSAVDGYVGGAVGDWFVDTVANVNNPSNPVTAVSNAVGGWMSNG